MKRFQTAFLLFITITVIFPGGIPAQENGPNNAENGASLVRTAFPIYPVIARTAHVQGNVEVAVVVGADGGVKSAVATSGPELLKQAAVDSAEHSQFECRGCSQGDNSVQILYTFVLKDQDTCNSPNTASSNQSATADQPPAANETNHVTVTSEAIMICDPASTFRRKRSMKCMYLWRCGL